MPLSKILHLVCLMVGIVDVSAQLSRADLTAALGADTASEVADQSQKIGDRAEALGVITADEHQKIISEMKQGMETVKKSYENIVSADEPALDFLKGDSPLGGEAADAASMPDYETYASPNDPLLNLTQRPKEFVPEGNVTDESKNRTEDLPKPAWKAYRDKVFKKLQNEGKQLAKEREQREEQKKELKKEMDAEQDKILAHNTALARSLYHSPRPCPCQCPRPAPCPCNHVVHPCAVKPVVKQVVVQTKVQVTTVSHCCHATKVVTSCCPSAHTLAPVHRQGEIISAPPSLPHTLKADTVPYGKMPNVNEHGVVMKKSAGAAQPAAPTPAPPVLKPAKIVGATL